MKHGRILFALATITLAACANNKSPQASDQKTFDVVGTFKNADSSETAKEYLRIGTDTVTLVRVCKAGTIGRIIHHFKGSTENKATLEVSVPARITATSIELLADAQKSAPEVGSDCIAKLSKGSMPYLFNYYRDLFLASADGSQVRYLRLGENHLSYSERIQGLPVRVANALGAPEINEKARDILRMDTGVAATEVDAATARDTGTAVTSLKSAFATGARKALDVIGNNPPSDF